MPSQLEWQPDEKPVFAFCESVTGIGPWHIRRVGPAGLKLGGGIDTPTLCGRVRPMGDHTASRRGGGGWDLRVRILPGHFVVPKGQKPICCPECADLYQKETASAPAT